MTRRVPFKTILPLVKNRPFATLGIIWTLLALIMMPVVYVFISSVIDPHENYDHKAIIKNGSVAKGIITTIKPNNNVTVNGEHPQVISYSYTLNGKENFDKFQTLDSDKTATLSAGAQLDIKVFNNQSAPVNLTPYKFPILIFLPLFGIFLIGGVIFSIIGLRPVIKMYRLYKHGVVKDAVITAMSLTQGLPISGMGRRVEVFYYHENKSGHRVYNNCATTDFSILGEKKTGDTIIILVAPDNENKSCLVPKGLVLQ